MPPVPGTTSIAPSPAHMPMSGKKRRRASWWGSVMLMLIVATFAGSAFVNNWNARISNTVSISVRDADTGARTFETLDLDSGVRTPYEGATQQPRNYFFNDGSIIGLEPAGIILRQGSTEGPASVLVASPVPPTDRTVLAVWGVRIAWISPGDGSVQVFEKTARGTYTPISIETSLFPNSLAFTEDGNALILAKFGITTTDFYTLTLSDGALTKGVTVTGLATLIPQTP